MYRLGTLHFKSHAEQRFSTFHSFYPLVCLKGDKVLVVPCCGLRDPATVQLAHQLQVLFVFQVYYIPFMLGWRFGCACSLSLRLRFMWVTLSANSFGYVSLFKISAKTWPRKSDTGKNSELKTFVVKFAIYVVA